MKYSHTRIDTAPIHSEYQQTYRRILPSLSAWIDGKKYNCVGFQVGWWKWDINVFFTTQEKE